MAGIMNLFGKKSGEERAYLEQHRARLYRIAYAWTHNPALADDLAQETLIKALTKCDQLRDPKACEAWLYSILTNCFRDHFRRSRETEDIDDLEIAHDRTPEQDARDLDIAAKVRAAIEQLPEGQRQVVTLVDLEGLSYVEVAQVLDVPIGTVMSRLCRARQALKGLLVYLRENAAGQSETSNYPAAGTRIRRIK
jgi:RNA polymerase sigma-70 factor (ECF subfamily)